MRQLKTHDMTSMPWKNGGGETLEVAISPVTAQLGHLDFDWRVSIATIASDGPFSTFPGYDRKLVVWSGESFLVNDVERLAMQPFSFAGEEKITTSLIATPIKDFGLITKRGAFNSSLSCHSLDNEATATADVSGNSFILCTRGELRIGVFYLNSGDIIHTTESGQLEIKALARSDYVVGSIVPA